MQQEPIENKNAEVGGNAVPRTRIADLFININILAAVLVGITAVFGPLIQYNDTLFWWHLTFGLGAVVLGLFALVSAMFYLVVSGMGIREAVIKHKLDFALFARTRDFKKELFPWCSAAVVLLIVMTVLGGGVHVKKISKYYHLAFSVVTVAVYLYAIRAMKTNYQKNAQLIAETLDAVDMAEAGR
jgi:hypothetical protein